MISTVKGPSKPLTGPLANAYGSRWASGALLPAIQFIFIPLDRTPQRHSLSLIIGSVSSARKLFFGWITVVRCRQGAWNLLFRRIQVPGQRHNLPNAWIGKLCSCPRPGMLSFGYRSQRTSTDTVSILKYVPKRRERSCTHAAPAAAPDSSDISRILTS